MYPLLCANTHHGITDLQVHRMARNAQKSLILEESWLRPHRLYILA